MVVVALVALGVAVLGPGPDAEAADGCLSWSGPTAEQPTLQSALDRNVCTQLPAGRYTVNAYLLIPDGHTLQGDPNAGREEVVVVADTASWNGNGFEGVINGTQPPHDPANGRATLQHFVIDGAGVSTGGAGASDMVVHDMTVRGARCWGVAIVGPNMTVTNSRITGNGASLTCPSPPGAGIYVAANNVTYGTYAPKIFDNEIVGNTGPGVDIYNVGGGQFRGNRVQGNTGWAGFSLLGSDWTVVGNVIDHPATGGGQPWLPSCSTGPSGAKPAAIFLCRDTAASGLTTSNNVIDGNTVSSSHYGVLLIGNDEASPAAVPRTNKVNNNKIAGTVTACADDNKRSGPTANSWTTGCKPVYF